MGQIWGASSRARTRLWGAPIILTNFEKGAVVVVTPRRNKNSFYVRVHACLQRAHHMGRKSFQGHSTGFFKHIFYVIFLVFVFVPHSLFYHDKSLFFFFFPFSNLSWPQLFFFFCPLYVFFCLYYVLHYVSFLLLTLSFSYLFCSCFRLSSSFRCSYSLFLLFCVICLLLCLLPQDVSVYLALCFI
jgi:hypothetical protein